MLGERADMGQARADMCQGRADIGWERADMAMGPKRADMGC